MSLGGLDSGRGFSVPDTPCRDMVDSDSLSGGNLSGSSGDVQLGSEVVVHGVRKGAFGLLSRPPVSSDNTDQIRNDGSEDIETDSSVSASSREDTVSDAEAAKRSTDVLPDLIPTEPKGRVKPTSVPRAGHGDDINFPMVSTYVARPFCAGNQGWADIFLGELLVADINGRELRESVKLAVPLEDDRAHDKKGMCVYWKMPKCGWWLTMTDFQKDLLKKLDIAPVQLASPAWCVVTSFERLFSEYAK